MNIYVKFNLRPCIVYGEPNVLCTRRGFFHMWNIGLNDKQVPSAVGLVEFEDGTIREVPPSFIHFIDTPNFDSYVWDRKEVEDE